MQTTTLTLTTLTVAPLFMVAIIADSEGLW